MSKLCCNVAQNQAHIFRRGLRTMGEIEIFTNELQRLVPSAIVRADTDALRTHAIDGVFPRLVVSPTSVEDVGQTVELASLNKLSVLPRGGGSGMNLGNIAEHIDILIDTTHLKRLLEHEGPDLTCHVEAGITLAELQVQLARQGQQLALDAPNAQQATIGGLLATNASGPKRLRYGTARDLVIGMRVVQANGELARSGGRVVKNVAGYDLNKLYIGSLGTLGMIVEANFKLHPLPPLERTLLLMYTNIDDAMQTILAILNSLLTPSALELIDAGAASDMTDFFGLNLPANGYTVAINFEGSKAAIERQLNETRLLARRNNALMGDDLDGDAQQRFWEVIREHTQGTLTCKVALLPSQIASYLRQLEETCQRYTLESATIAHAGNGILYIELRPSDATPRLISALEELRKYARELHGSLVVERCPVELKRRISIWGEPGGDFYLMQRLKQQFDPQRTFVGGRFLGGL
ncbi:FAD-binding oxidoreductase [Ktedonosporobacter rubrisoli]|uniref:FAD-binding oxidoreductase n=1 Tax=Ktedonosporobacter rubrisoli TaxID=2509675 RepID=A0A4P6JRW6_KTERU|nr:FAD-binding oxidoreductase [Ktedonosporobacter rubrisoli]QBD78237.1 FAD-binding oxidoreductase [Ktedonosporobacter rubrisoli]